MSTPSDFDRWMAVQDEQAAWDRAMGVAELTTDELDAYDAARSRREALGIGEAEVDVERGHEPGQ
jgi:hypothetical protein